MGEIAFSPNLDERHVGIVIDRHKVKTAIAFDKVTAVVRYEDCSMPARHRPKVRLFSAGTLAIYPAIGVRLHRDADLATRGARYMGARRGQRSIRGRVHR
jgi:hypothetical protein